MVKSFFLAILVFMLSCSSFQAMKPQMSPIKFQETSVELYSKGLLLKNKNKYADAIAYFEKAGKEGINLDVIYYQIAECYFYLFDFAKAVEFAQKSILENENFDKPYLLQYSVYMNLNQLDKATEIFENLLQKRPDLYRVRFNLASVYYSQLKQNIKARHHFLRIIQHGEYDDVDSYFLEQSYFFLGHIYYSFNEYKKSYELFSRALDKNKENYSLLYILGLLNLEKGNIDQALSYLLQFLERHPDDLKALLHVSRIYYIYGDMKALPLLRRAIDNRSPEGLLAQLMYNELLQKDEKAEELAKRLNVMNSALDMPYIALARIALRKEDYPSAAMNFFNAGVLLYEKKHYDAAAIMMVKAVEIDQDAIEKYLYLGQIFEDAEQFRRAIFYYSTAHSKKEQQDVLLRIGYIYALLQDYTKAFEYFSKADERDKNSHSVFFFKGLAYLKKGEYADAEKMFRQAVTIKKSESYYFYLAAVVDKQQRTSDAIAILQEAYANGLQSPRIFNYLGYLYADNNMKLEESYELINAALEDDPTNGAYLDSLGWVYFRMGEYHKALPLLLEAAFELELEGHSDSVVYDHIGDVYNALQLPDKAVEYWNKAYKLHQKPEIKKKIDAHTIR